MTLAPAAASALPPPADVGDELTVALHDVARSFGANPALRGLNLRVPRGCITVLLGPNGAGKTTAIRMITGALSPDVGEVRVFGLDPRTAGEEVRRRCGVVSAKPSLYDRLSGYDNLAYSAELYGLGRDPSMGDRIVDAARRFGIDHALGQQAGGYSTGMKTRLALARAVLHRPELLLFDEPTSGLDPESSIAVLELIREMTATGVTVVMCTHLLLEAEGLADQVVVLEDGRALIAGTPAELTARYWPAAVVRLDAVDRAGLTTALATTGGVLRVEHPDGDRSAPVLAQLDNLDRLPDVVADLVATGVRLTRVEPHSPSLEDLYFAVRGRRRPEGGAVPRDETPVRDVALSSGNRLGRRFRDPFAAAPGGDG